jgi:hypothetical protein
LTITPSKKAVDRRAQRASAAASFGVAAGVELGVGGGHRLHGGVQVLSAASANSNASTPTRLAVRLLEDVGDALVGRGQRGASGSAAKARTACQLGKAPRPGASGAGPARHRLPGAVALLAQARLRDGRR